MMSVRNGWVNCSVHGSVVPLPEDGDSTWQAMLDHLLAEPASHGLCGEGLITCPMPWVCDICPAAVTWLQSIGT